MWHPEAFNYKYFIPAWFDELTQFMLEGHCVSLINVDARHFPVAHEVRSKKNSKYAICILAAWMMHESQTVDFLLGLLAPHNVTTRREDVPQTSTETDVVRPSYHVTGTALRSLHPWSFPCDSVIDAFLSIFLLLAASY